MLNKIEVYSSSQLAADLSFDEEGLIENDFVQVTNIDGLDPVPASIDVVSSDNVDGAVSLEPKVPTRNIVMTLRPNPNWNDWTFETLRKLIYSYFIPKSTVKLVFDSDEIGVPVEILGTIESCEANPFTKDPEYIVSIVCPDPYFITIDPVIVTGTVIHPDNWTSEQSTISLDGNVPIGIEVILSSGFSTELYIQIGNLGNPNFHVITTVEDMFSMGSRPLNKFIRKVNLSNGAFENLLPKLQFGSAWPVLKPGDNPFAIMDGFSLGNPWELKYFPKYGGI